PSKNNPKKSTLKSSSFTNGVETEFSPTVTTYSYTYNQRNLVTKIQTSPAGGTSMLTEVTYDLCD
ncbi:MAG: hypothetical protein ACOYW3_06155, partial [Bacteroidota bacterium]